MNENEAAMEVYGQGAADDSSALCKRVLPCPDESQLGFAGAVPK